ncbi:hypothetical protein AM493_19115 [Flavobacterium akiainvivens]|uniref:Protein-glutamine gamma-glutamyltransferase-like C-terminal domain-containing protein n=1 Tax=Flavobacterium akiainvivens TaxID=1202724 RepID=A0A0M9VK38_9FLAO|nr:hypothetical protein AM493_19115 [Flavobacterium akiainvivens]
MTFLCGLPAGAQEYAPIEAADTLYEEEYYPEDVVDSVVPKESDYTVIDAPVYKQRTFKKDYKEKYNNSDFNYTEEQTKERSLLMRFLEWLYRVLSGGFIRNEDGSTSGVGIIWYIFAVLVILGVAYIIAWAIMGKESVWIFGRGRKGISVYDVDEENIHEMDFATLIDQTQREGNYRLAVRYYYLWLLKKLSYREVISWHTDKTNNDYYYEIKDPALRDDFKYLSYVYDHSWYGEFPIDNTSYAKAEKAFQQTLNKL